MLNMLPSAQKMRAKIHSDEKKFGKVKPLPEATPHLTNADCDSAPDPKHTNNTAKSYASLLRHHRLRPTRQRLIIATHLFTSPCRHVHADMLHEEIAATGKIISVATIYNSLRAFCTSGLIRAVASRGIRQWFCTDVNNSCQCYFDDGEYIEPLTEFSFPNLPTQINQDYLPPSDFIPKGYKVAHIDISIHLEKIDNKRKSIIRNFG